MGEKLSPFVYWAQTDSSISLRVDLKNVQSPNVILKEEELEFSAIGLGAKGRNEYHFELRFFLAVDIKESQFRVKDQYVEFSIIKKNIQWWPRLIVNHQKPAWLKIDFDKWKSEDADSVDEKSIDEQIKDIFDPKKEKVMQDEAYTIIYLFMYSMFQLSGYAIILMLLVFFFISDGSASQRNAFSNVGALLMFFQASQLLEIIFSIYGWAISKNIAELIQIVGRLIVVICFIAVEPRMHKQIVVFYAFIIWTLLEIIRYSFNMLQLFDVEWGVLTWLHHSIWIPLYPLSFICEGVVIFKNLPFYEETMRFSFHLPNALNWSFDVPSLMRVYLMFVSFPLLFTSMANMYKQRVRVLGNRKSKFKPD